MTSKLMVTGNYPRYISEFALLTSTIILFLWFAHLGGTSANILRELMIFTMAGMRLLPAGQRAVAMVNQLKQGLPDTQAILDSLKAPQIDLPRISSDHGKTAPFERDIVFQNIAFHYADESAVIPEGTCLRLNRGEWLYLRGPSGIGKTTLLSLLLGLIAPTRGQIIVDGKIRSALGQFRGYAIAMVTQDYRPLPGTLAENLAFPLSADNLDKQKAQNLLRQLGLEIDLDTLVGEDGARLSGGQRQRLAIVKALLAQPQLLILDEATSQLDRASETAVFHLIRTYLPNATVIIVAHKLETSLVFDRHWHWENGRWVDHISSETR